MALRDIEWRSWGPRARAAGTCPRVRDGIDLYLAPCPQFAGRGLMLLDQVSLTGKRLSIPRERQLNQDYADRAKCITSCDSYICVHREYYENRERSFTHPLSSDGQGIKWYGMTRSSI